MATNRLRRQPASRRGPIRNRVVPSFEDPRSSVFGAGLEVARVSAEAARSSVESTVAAAYAVIDQYMNRGYAAASNHQRFNGGAPMTGPDTSNNGWSRSNPGMTDPWGVWSAWNMWMEPWMQAMRFWTDGMNMATRPANPMNPLSSMMAMGGNPGMSLHVQSSRATTVTLDLAPGSDFQQLHVDKLYHTTDQKPAPLDGVVIDARPGLYAVRLEVSDAQPPGVYVGAVRGPQNQPVGDLCVEIVGDPVVATSREPKRQAARKTRTRAVKKASAPAARKKSTGERKKAATPRKESSTAARKKSSTAARKKSTAAAKKKGAAAARKKKAPAKKKGSRSSRSR